MPLRCKKGPYFPYIKINIYNKYITGLFGYFLHLPTLLPSTHLYYITLLHSCQSISSIINKTLTISISHSLFPTFLFKMTTRRSRFLHLRTVRFDKWKTVWRRPERSEGTRRKDEVFSGKGGYGNHGFPIYNGYNQEVKQEIKKQRGYPNTI